MCFNFSFRFFESLVDISMVITSSPVAVKNCACAMTAGNNKSIIKKKKKEHDKTVLLPATKLNLIEVLMSGDLIDSYISHGEFFSVNNVLGEQDDMKE